MALSYGILYRFLFKSQNGWAVEIYISKAGYAGEIHNRPLGRAPLLRRDNNGGIYGTSLELYAECRVPGEYAQLYTSSAFEYRLEVYRNGQKLWSGFLTPELYSEPDRPAPYDVRIVATDGLGELKRSKFYSQGTRTLREHLMQILDSTNMTRQIVEVSSLSYDTGTQTLFPSAMLDNVSIDLSHEDGNTRYEVLQHILSSLNAGITLHLTQWLLFRETDFIRRAAAEGVSAYSDGVAATLPVATFGSSKVSQWWPLGNMSVIAEPARRYVEIKSPFHYMENMFGSWNMGNSAQYSSEEKAYILPTANSYILQMFSFAAENLEHRLALKILARNVGEGVDPQNLSIMIGIQGTGYQGSGAYSLVQAANGNYAWRSANGSILAELSAPTISETAEDAEEVSIIIPLFRKDSRAFMYASSLAVQISNPTGDYPIYVHDVTLVKYEQPEGQIADVEINNGSREAASSVDLHMTDGASVPVGGRWSMTGIPYKSDGQIITRWILSGTMEYMDYLSLMAQDYAQKVGAVRLRYSGKLNVPYNQPLPCLFMRDNTFYFPRTYSYDLYNDEMEVDLISVPDADVAIASADVTIE